MKLKISSGEACIRLWLQRACGENESGIMQRAAALQVWPIDGACFLKHIQFDDICYVLTLWKTSQTFRASDLVCLFPAWHFRMNGLKNNLNRNWSDIPTMSAKRLGWSRNIFFPIDHRSSLWHLLTLTSNVLELFPSKGKTCMLYASKWAT